MTKREQLLAAINHEEGMIPSWTMAFFNLDLAKKLLGEENVMTDYLPCSGFKTGCADADNRERNVRYAQAVDNFAIAVGKGGNFAFGHGGPGEFLDKLVESGENYAISVYETGVKKLTKKNPHFYHHYDYPMATLEDIDALVLPNASDPIRYEGIDEDAAFYRKCGYLPYANLNGLFSAIHYFCYPYDKILMDLLLEPEQIRTLIRRIAEFNLTAAEQLLRCGVEMITTCDDLGDGRSLLFSPEVFQQMFAPYYHELAELCHSYGAVLHLHSHGNIRKVLPMLADAKIDLINPFDPYEVGDIDEIKDQFGKRITIVGGMHRYFFNSDREQMRSLMLKSVNAARKGGGYIWMDNGGIPENVTKETYNYYRNLSAELRSKGA